MSKQREDAPDDFVWLNGVRWVDAAHMQVWRLEEAFYEWHAALADAKLRFRLNDPSEISRSWRDGLDRDYDPYDSQRPSRVPTLSLTMQVANELDLLLIATRNVLRAQERIPASYRATAMHDQKVLLTLRNIHEHWDEIGGPSAEQLARDYPHIEHGQIAFTNKEIWIGGDEGIPLSRITAWLVRVHHALAAALREKAGIDVTDLGASRVEGDDDLPWPQPRLRFHWSIARVDEQYWPQDEVPPDVAEALAAMLARRRARDPHD